MNLDRPVDLMLRSEDTSVECRCYSYGVANNKFAYALIAGPEQTCQAVFSSIVSRKGMVFIDGKRVEFDENYNFRREATRVQPMSTRWVAMLIMTKDPGVIYQDNDDAFVSTLKKITTTPFVEGWADYLRKQLTQQKLMTKLTGHHAAGSYLSVKTEELDAIVSEGLRRKALSIL